MCLLDRIYDKLKPKQFDVKKLIKIFFCGLTKISFKRIMQKILQGQNCNTIKRKTSNVKDCRKS